MSIPSIEDEEYRLLYQECFTLYLNRIRPTRSPIRFGCRISGFLYALISLLWNKDRDAKDRSLWKTKRINIDAFVHNVSIIIQFGDGVSRPDVSIPDPILNSIFINNRISGHCAVLTAEGPSHVDEITTESFMKIPLKMDQFGDLFETFPVAIFGIVFTDGPLQDTIMHYFAVRKEEDKYILISSYGSDNIEIGQYETPLNMDDFTNYVRQLSSDERDMDFVRDFMKKYFLDSKRGLLFSGKPPIHIDADGNEVEKNTDVNIEAEINVYYGNRAGQYFHFEIVSFPHAIDQMRSLLQLSGGMRKKKTRKGKRKHYVHRTRRYRYRSLHKK
jgi:hypothetical protein